MEFEKFKEELMGKLADISKDKTEMKQRQEQFEKAIKDLEQLKSFDEKMAMMQKAMEAQGLELQKMNAMKSQRPLTFAEDMRKMILEDRQKDWERLKNSRNGSFEFDIAAFDMDKKTVGDMSRSNVTGSTSIWKSVFETTIEGAPNTVPRLLNLFPKANTEKSQNSWIERTGGEGAPDMKLETQKFAQVDYDWVEYTLDLQKVTAYSKITNEMMEDLDALVSDVQTELLADVLDKIDKQLWIGNGTPPQLNGLYATKSTAFDPTGIEFDEANYYDLLKAMANQAVVAGFYPNFAIMHPTDVMLMETTKKNGQYVIPPFRSATGLEVAGVKVIPHTNVTPNTCLVGDFTKSKVFFQRNIRVMIYDQNEDDALYDRRTITVTGKLALRVKGIHTTAFVKCADIAAAITSLTPAS